MAKAPSDTFPLLPAMISAAAGNANGARPGGNRA
jgi:hypothetical protein